MPMFMKSMSGINTLIVHSPEEALALAGGLLAAGGVIKLADILRHVDPDMELSDEEKLELELLDEQAPKGFFTKAVASVHGSLIERKMRATPVIPKLWWKHGEWDIRHRGVTWTSDPSFDPLASAFDWTDVSTPALEDGKLV
jgi:hypothetical protein